MHKRLSVHSICFPAADLSDIAAKWRALRPRRVSVLSPLLEQGLAGVLEDEGYELEAVTHKFTEGHLSTRVDGWEYEQDKLAKVLETTASLGGRSVYMITGGHGSLTWQEAAETFVRAVAPCVALADELKVDLLIESVPVLYAEGHIAHTLRDTVALAEQAGIGVCIDIFSCWSEAGLRQTIERAMPRTRLVQVGDYVFGDKAYPCRQIPGEGDLPLRRIIGWILGAGYQGNFDIEILGPRIDEVGSVEAVRRAGDYLGGLLDDLGA